MYFLFLDFRVIFSNRCCILEYKDNAAINIWYWVVTQKCNIKLYYCSRRGCLAHQIQLRNRYLQLFSRHWSCFHKSETCCFMVWKIKRRKIFIKFDQRRCLDFFFFFRWTHLEKLSLDLFFSRRSWLGVDLFFDIWDFWTWWELSIYFLT